MKDSEESTRIFDDIPIIRKSGAKSTLSSLQTTGGALSTKELLPSSPEATATLSKEINQTEGLDGASKIVTFALSITSEQKMPRIFFFHSV